MHDELRRGRAATLAQRPHELRDLMLSGLKSPRHPTAKQITHYGFYSPYSFYSFYCLYSPYSPYSLYCPYSLYSPYQIETLKSTITL